MNNDTNTPINMTATNDRRIADLRAATFTMPDRPARRLPPRSRNTSRRHRAIR